MKKIAVIVLGILILSASATAQSKFGVKGGLNFNSLKDISENVDNTWSKQTGYHFGVTYQFKVPVIGIGLQPDLLFVRQRAENSIGPNQSFYLDYLTLPLNIQLGLDLLLIRPFIMFSPYVSYAVGKGESFETAEWDDINRFDYGYGIGAGIDIWKLQVSGKYNWGLGKLQSAGDGAINGETFKNAKLQGFQLSVSIMF